VGMGYTVNRPVHIAHKAAQAWVGKFLIHVVMSLCGLNGLVCGSTCLSAFCINIILFKRVTILK